VGRLADFLRAPFSFLSGGTKVDDRVVAYVLREHGRGRALAEILEDPFIRNRLTPQQRERLLDRPEIIRAVGDDVVASTRAEQAS
jgi:hypothetical protein